MADVLPIGARANVSPAVLTVLELARQFLDFKALECKAGLICPSLLSRLRRHLDDFTRTYGALTPETVRGTDVTRWILAHDGWVADSYRQNAARSVQGAFVWATDEGLLTRNPIRKIKPCWGVLQPRGAILPGEFRAILDTARSCDGRRRRACPGRRAFRVAFWFLWQTGCRTCEMREALWADVDWQAGLIRLDRHKTRRTSGRARLIPLTAAAIRLLRLLFRRQRPGQTHVFVTSRGGPWTCRNFDDMAKQFRELAAVRDSCTPYTLRHAWTVAGLEAGEGSRQLADVLGQANTRLIDWYGADAKAKADYLRAIAARVRP